MGRTVDCEQAQIRPKGLNDDGGLMEGTDTKPREISRNIWYLCAEIRTGFHQNTRLERRHYTVYSVRRIKWYNSQYDSWQFLEIRVLGVLFGFSIELCTFNKLLQNFKALKHYTPVVTCMSNCRRGLDWLLDLLNTYTHKSLLQIIIGHTLSVHSLLSLVVSW
jgi:hypothetical protein